MLYSPQLKEEENAVAPARSKPESLSYQWALIINHGT